MELLIPIEPFAGMINLLFVSRLSKPNLILNPSRRYGLNRPGFSGEQKVKWDYDRELYKLRNEIERLFRRFKGCRRIFTRFDKLDATYLGFVSLAAVVEMMHDLA